MSQCKIKINARAANRQRLTKKDKMLKERQNPDNLTHLKTKCKCGRKIIVNRKFHNSEEFLCSTCKTYGIDESRKMFLEINRKSDTTSFT